MLLMLAYALRETPGPKAHASGDSGERAGFGSVQTGMVSLYLHLLSLYLHLLLMHSQLMHVEISETVLVQACDTIIYLAEISPAEPLYFLTSLSLSEVTLAFTSCILLLQPFLKFKASDGR